MTIDDEFTRTPIPQTCQPPLPETDWEIKNTLRSLEPYELIDDEYVVIGGANLLLRGLIDYTPDIDMLVSPSTFDRLYGNAAVKNPPARAVAAGATSQSLRLEEGPMPVTAAVQLGDSRYSMSFEQAFEQSAIIQGVRCLHAAVVMEWKLSVRRPRDIWAGQLVLTPLYQAGQLTEAEYERLCNMLRDAEADPNLAGDDY